MPTYSLPVTNRLPMHSAFPFPLSISHAIFFFIYSKKHPKTPSACTSRAKKTEIYYRQQSIMYLLSFWAKRCPTSTNGLTAKRAPSQATHLTRFQSITLFSYRNHPFARTLKLGTILSSNMKFF